jgi:tubulin-specific chaperone A
MHSAEYDIQFQAELEESNQKEGAEIEEARSTIAEVEQFFQTTEA